MKTLAVLMSIASVAAAQPDETRLLRAQNKLLEAKVHQLSKTVTSLQKQLADLAAENARLKQETARLRERLAGAGIEEPTTRPASAVKPDDPAFESVAVMARSVPKDLWPATRGTPSDRASRQERIKQWFKDHCVGQVIRAHGYVQAKYPKGTNPRKPGPPKLRCFGYKGTWKKGQLKYHWHCGSIEATLRPDQASRLANLRTGREAPTEDGPIPGQNAALLGGSRVVVAGRIAGGVLTLHRFGQTLYFRLNLTLTDAVLAGR